MSNVDVVRGVYEAFGRGDVPAVLGAMDPAIRWHEAEGSPYGSSGEGWTGPDAVLNELLVKLGEDWDLFLVDPKTFHDAGAVVVVEVRYRGKHRETGRELDAQACHVWTVRNGKLTGFQGYVDTARLQDVMGARATA